LNRKKVVHFKPQNDKLYHGVEERSDVTELILATG